jgi:16S rRNA (uracil1498-N3)-methyltransferase
VVILEEQLIDITITNFIVEPANITAGRLTLVGDEARHLSQVLRAKVGDTFSAIDGSGMKYRAIIQVIEKNSVSGLISATTRLENEPLFHVALAQGICRPNKMDEIVEKGTELGVSSFIFYYSDKGYSRPDEDGSPDKKISRLIKVTRAAAKQSRRSIIPQIQELIAYEDLLDLRKNYDLALAALIDPTSRPVVYYLDNPSQLKKILLLVGPESGLSKDEEAACLAAGFMPASLGPRRLRTETAGILFPALVLNHLGDL